MVLLWQVGCKNLTVLCFSTDRTSSEKIGRDDVEKEYKEKIVPALQVECDDRCYVVLIVVRGQISSLLIPGPLNTPWRRTM
jgi:hypothetical protein